MKQCTYCKTENEDQAIQCANCGLPLIGNEADTAPQDTTPEPQQQEQQAPLAKPKKKKAARTMIIAAVAAVVVVAILLGVVLSSGVIRPKSKFMFPETTLWVVANASETESTLLVDTDVRASEDVYIPYSGTSSLNGTTQVLYSPEDGAYVATKDGFSPLGELFSFKVANTGQGVAYKDNDGKLYLQTVPLQEEPLLLCEQAGNFAISPDGETVAYVTQEAEEYVLYVYHEGAHTKIGSNLEAVAISDDGQYIYCSSISGMSLSLANLSGQVTELTEGVYSFFILNQDNTQLIYCGGTEWFVVDHGENIKIEGFMEEMVPAPEAYMVTPVGASTSGTEYGSSIVTYGVENLAENYYTSYLTLCYVDASWKAHTVSGDLYSLAAYGRISRDGNTVFYAEGPTLYRVKDADLENKEAVATDIYAFVVTSDGEAVYYLDDNSTLWYRKVGKEAVKLADSADRIYITHDDYLLFMTSPYGEESDLYAVKDGSKPKLIADRVSHVYLTDSVSYYFQFTEEGDYRYDLYGTKSGTNFRFITKDS